VRIAHRPAPALTRLLASAALLLALAGCSLGTVATPTATPGARPRAASPTPNAPRYGGRVTIGIVGDLPDLNPALDGNDLAAILFRPVVEGLFSFDREGRPQPWLAESVPAAGRGVSDDGRVVILRVRQGVAWEDGRAVTAEDVRFAHDIALNPANPLPPDVVAANAAIRTLDVLDSYTVRLGYDGPDDSYLRAFPLLFPEHLFNGQTTLAGHPYSRAPFGTGPFRFSEWVPGDHLTLVRSATYRDTDRPYLDELVYRQFPDQAAAEAARRSRAIDLLLAPDRASFLAPLPAAIHNLAPDSGAPPTRTAREWWREK
jgi:peptide/nickel transport system substrate-binding protein